MGRAALLDETIDGQRPAPGLRALLKRRLGVAAVQRLEVESGHVGVEEAPRRRSSRPNAAVEEKSREHGFERVCEARVAAAAARALLTG